MRKSTRLQVVLAAVVVILAGAVMVWAGEEEIRVMVKKVDADQITIDINDVSEVVTLEDLADGEERTFDAGEHKVIVRRVGDELDLVLDDGRLVDLLDGVEGKGKAKRVMVFADGGEAHAKTISVDGSRHVIIHRGDGEIDVESDIVVDLEDCEDIEAHKVLVHRLGKGEDHKMMFISEDGEVTDAEEMAVLLAGVDDDLHWVGSHGCHGDYVTYECPEDGTRLQLKKDKDQGGDQICPICGSTLEKKEGPQIVKKKVRVEVFETADDEESGDDD